MTVASAGDERRCLLVDGRHQPHQEGPPEWIHRQPRAVCICWATVAFLAVDVPVIMLHKFQQFHVVYILILGAEADPVE